MRDLLRRAVTKFVRDCPVCQLRSVLHRQIKTHRFTTASYTPMEVLNIDTIGPVSKDSADNCYILVVVQRSWWEKRGLRLDRQDRVVNITARVNG